MSALNAMVGPAHTLRQAAERMIENRTGASVVMDPDLPGPCVITERDLLKALAAGLDPKLYSGHSLRAGHVTEARARGVADSTTMATTGHTRVETLDMYDRRENVFQKTSAGDVLKPR